MHNNNHDNVSLENVLFARMNNNVIYIIILLLERILM